MKGQVVLDEKIKHRTFVQETGVQGLFESKNYSFIEFLQLLCIYFFQATEISSLEKDCVSLCVCFFFFAFYNFSHVSGMRLMLKQLVLTPKPNQTETES